MGCTDSLKEESARPTSILSVRQQATVFVLMCAP